MNHKKSSHEQDKKPYRPPRLTHYGAIHAITQAVAQMGNLDGGRVLPRTGASG